uniref:ATP synthase complex subunit 8 n=1 Tax=Tridentiger bifasciatus TaxID=55553 RepID=G1FNH7_9GOBI|nr:ATP synthase F0 subunit 8 [Tridentiger bifasciatus]AEM23529.1 ATP synthase F0 subunit 8 [Tridentiger bifasciatus]UFH80710.1 ATP synthase F0 subunit 8 [Tridentiger bifasciatus]
MPQLNPAPWFVMLLLSWSVFLTIVLPKTLDHTFPNEPTSQNTKNSKKGKWTWPW